MACGLPGYKIAKNYYLFPLLVLFRDHNQTRDLEKEFGRLPNFIDGPIFKVGIEKLFIDLSVIVRSAALLLKNGILY